MPTRNNQNVRVYLQGYKVASRGMTTIQGELQRQLPVINDVFRRERDNVPPRVIDPNQRIIYKTCLVNWGVPRELIHAPLAKDKYFILNNSGTARASSKALFFSVYGSGHYEGPRLPWWTANRAAAQEYVSSRNRRTDGPVLVERHVVSGHSGNGIRLVNANEEVRLAPLYTAYIKKKDEYRVHFFKHPGEETQYFVQQKRLRQDHPEGDIFKIRNKSNGWVYCHNEVSHNAAVLQQAHIMAELSSLDFGAIDIIWNESEGGAYILEINTAPGVEGETGRWYARQIATACRNHNFASTSGRYTA